MPIELNILCWDHPRCMTPMRAAAQKWMETHPQVRLFLTSRPLSDFNDQPLQEVARSVDLLLVDHPMMETAACSGALAPLDGLVSQEELEELAADSVGSSHDTYNWDGHQLATAVDAACQVAVVQDERLDQLEISTPRSWDDVLQLARIHPGTVAMPLYPSDAIISLLTISANLGGAGQAGASLIDRSAVDLLVELAQLIDPRSYEWNPPRLLDCMSTGGDSAPAYAPLTFGYTNYQRPSLTRGRLRFCDIPSFSEAPSGSVLGGAGLAVTSACHHQDQAASFAAWMAGRAAQRELVVVNDGQPASKATWDDPVADELVGGFFSGTRATIESSFVRPRNAWWPNFQDEAGLLLVESLRARTSPGEILSGLNTLEASQRKEKSA